MISFHFFDLIIIYYILYISYISYISFVVKCSKKKYFNSFGIFYYVLYKFLVYLIYLKKHDDFFLNLYVNEENSVCIFKFFHNNLNTVKMLFASAFHMI